MYKNVLLKSILIIEIILLSLYYLHGMYDYLRNIETCVSFK